MIEILAIAVALAMDAFAVAVATGAGLSRLTPRHVFRLAWHFGLFQAVMPVAGWWMGLTVRSFVEDWAHWCAFGLLAFIGVRMFAEAMNDECECRDDDPTCGATLVMLSVATSIDALAVGAGYSLMGRPILMPSVVIGVVAFAFTAAGICLGRLLGAACSFGRYAGMIGGITLVGIGLNLLREKGVFASLF
ncbi:putative Mn2+ efflux pump MntP [Desulfobaculum xiamenense]|uniref:Putative manganese efflux pump MntP n=1 Tax=Desulfobaculum xiamenense TaxID=995050 RepID=A0A846QQZ9_9BACT|nr:manganese efflux pump MntP family protein [Desulfobaculum xiamenense]NJB67815.1 putative Mn2+ efflux pump MntP [Desulfobaculum xiamenense]